MSDSLATLRTVACQAPLSMGFPRQEYWNGLLFSPDYLPYPVIEPLSPALAGGLFLAVLGLKMEKTLMLRGIGYRRKRGRQRMRWLDGITDLMDMSLGELSNS